MIDKRARRWNWRTWNLLLQIQQATDGEDSRQRGGEMDTRGLCIPSGRPEMLALRKRGFVESKESGEIFDDNTGNSKVYPVWTVTVAGRMALDDARAEQITIQ